jgi:hypothetical protein
VLLFRLASAAVVDGAKWCDYLSERLACAESNAQSAARREKRIEWQPNETDEPPVAGTADIPVRNERFMREILKMRGCSRWRNQLNAASDEMLFRA